MTERPTVAIHTLGCKLNQAESEKLAQELSGAGYSLQTGQADIHILNTCTVTHIADRKSRHMVRMLRRQNPQAFIVVTGCYAGDAAGELIGCGADWVVDNRHKMSLPRMMDSKINKPTSGSCAHDSESWTEKVRGFIKIQDGCNHYCSYCIVPYVRSNVFSLDADEVIKEITQRVRAGYAEVVITGTEIGTYSNDELDLRGLIKRILKETGAKRLHLSSLQPQGISRELLDLWDDGRLVRHFHLALQSGSDAVLQRMRRSYNKRQFKKTMDVILDIMPDASITTDIIVGFPGESNEEFGESYNFCREAGFAAMHVFSYSARPGTRAAKMPGKVSDRVKKERSLQMLELAAFKADAFSRRFIGQTREVLWENEVGRRSGIYSGLTDNYIRTYAKSERNLTARLLKTRLIDKAGDMHGLALKASTRGNHGELWSEVLK